MPVLILITKLFLKLIAIKRNNKFCTYEEGARSLTPLNPEKRTNEENEWPFCRHMDGNTLFF
jgi:hypothetical protein